MIYPQILSKVFYLIKVNHIFKKDIANIIISETMFKRKNVLDAHHCITINPIKSQPLAANRYGAGRDPSGICPVI